MNANLFLSHAWHRVCPKLPKTSRILCTLMRIFLCFWLLQYCLDSFCCAQNAQQDAFMFSLTRRTSSSVNDNAFSGLVGSVLAVGSSLRSFLYDLAGGKGSFLFLFRCCNLKGEALLGSNVEMTGTFLSSYTSFFSKEVRLSESFGIDLILKASDKLGV